jgi:hypothetical protein
MYIPGASLSEDEQQLVEQYGHTAGHVIASQKRKLDDQMTPKEGAEYFLNRAMANNLSLLEEKNIGCDLLAAAQAEIKTYKEAETKATAKEPL